MKKEMIKFAVKMFGLGFCFCAVIIVSYLFFTNDLPFMRAAGVGTGAPDINAKYHDGYATSLTATSGVMYVSDGSNYLPDSTVDTGAIVDGTIVTGDIATDTILAGNIAAGAVGTSEIAANAVGDSELSVSYTWPADISCGTGFTDMGTYCIQTAEANSGTGLNWYAATDYCYDNYEGRLCTSSEWYAGCMNGGLTNITDDWEWVDSWNANTSALRRGDGSCTDVDYAYAASNSYVFRCCK